MSTRFGQYQSGIRELVKVKIGMFCLMFAYLIQRKMFGTYSHSLDMHVYISSEARGLNYWLSSPILPLREYVPQKGRWAYLD